MSSQPIMRLRRVSVSFDLHRSILGRAQAKLLAVRDVSLSINAGETFGLVGESGCGKTTLCRTMMRLYEPDAGQIFFEDEDITTLSRRVLRPLRKNFQMIFQDPYNALNPRHTVLEIIEEPMLIHGMRDRAERRKRCLELLDRVGLRAEALERFPHEFSGGQRQRIGIARALALNPKLIVCDEPVSALDVSVQAQIINLLMELQNDLDLTYVFVAHNLSVVKQISHRIAVMYLGRIVEIAGAYDLYESPKHPYTAALIAAIPNPNPHKRSGLKPLSGEIPSPTKPPSGCAFHPRCPRASKRCSEEVPELEELPSEFKQSRMVACHHPM